MVSRTGGKIITGGERMLGRSALDAFDLSQGSFFPPTIVSEVSSDDELWKEEIFGPVVVVRRFSVSILLHDRHWQQPMLRVSGGEGRRRVS